MYSLNTAKSGYRTEANFGPRAQATKQTSTNKVCQVPTPFYDKSLNISSTLLSLVFLPQAPMIENFNKLIHRH
jgi:hypothetical protein